MLFLLFYLAASDIFSNKTLDYIVPSVSHTTTLEAFPVNKSIKIGAQISDNVAVRDAFLFFKRSKSDIYISIPMQFDGKGRYYAEIPKEEVYGETIEYFLKAEDTSGNQNYQGNMETPLIIYLYAP